MALLIKNGELVTPQGRRRADILCDDERISRVSAGIGAPPGAEVVDAAGCYVFPGFVDPHVHVYLPLKTTCSKDTYETAGVAALMGGTTCFIDFCSPERDQTPLEAWEIWDKQSRDHAACDYSYHMAVTRFDESIAEQLSEVIRRGVTSFKVYLAYKDSVALPLDQLDALLAFASRERVLIMGHCEDADEIERRQIELIRAGKTGPEWHYHSRPPEVEAAGTRLFLEMARKRGAPAYVVHLSCREALEAARGVGTIGRAAWIETLISFLVLDRTYAERSDFEGAKYIVSPPLRDRDNQSVLWQALAAGEISTVATDHAPFDFVGQKSLGCQDFRKIPNGMPTLENRIHLLYAFGVLGGHLTLEKMVEVAATNPAKLFGLFPRKGCLDVGSDADLVVFNPRASTAISARTHHMNVDYNPFEGWNVPGRVDTVVARGKVVCRDGRFCGKAGEGRFLARSSFVPPA
jgi:dihydropyrimidinase